MSKVPRLKCRIWTLSRDLQCFLKVLQNRSEKLKSDIPSAILSISLGFYNDFRIVDTFFTINLQTFEGQNSEVHFARQKQCFGEHLCARLQPQLFFSRFPYKTVAKTTKMKPKKNNTKEPEGTRGALHHPNTIEKSEPLIASDVRGKMPLRKCGK